MLKIALYLFGRGRVEGVILHTKVTTLYTGYQRKTIVFLNNIMKSFHIIRCIFKQLWQVNIVQLFSWFIELKFSFKVQYTN